MTYGLPNEECREVTIAVDEALANIIRHEYRNRHDQEIEFECSVQDERMSSCYSIGERRRIQPKFDHPTDAWFRSVVSSSRTADPGYA